MFKKTLLFLFLCLNVSACWALRFPLPEKAEGVFGHVQFAQTKQGDTFETVAQQYDVGFYELVEANPSVDPEQPLLGTELIIPTQYIMPDVKREGIVVNLAAMRLYYFPKGKPYFYTYPVGIGKQGWNTPLGPSSITQKIKDPVWYVPDSIYAYREKIGDPVAHVVQAGPDNPLGAFAMRLAQPTYLIHGTNEPGSVGRRSSAGCIHLYADDIKALYTMVPLHTKVLIINTPYLVGKEGDRIYLEAHQPLQEQRAELADHEKVLNALLKGITLQNGVTIDSEKAQAVLEEQTGLATQISLSK